MSAETSSGDVSHIQDEDVLRKMWQDTEDFGRKKEIRSHMYKLREDRLKNFYSSQESNIDTQRTQTTSGVYEKQSTTKEGNGPTHTDSLADHSFLSLKSKEIRDSESPTREMHYRVTGQKTRGDQDWNVATKNETSSDGKTQSTTHTATTSGTEQIQGGVATYAGKCEQTASVYNDGDANNFTKSVAASSRSVLQQEAKGGDDNSKFQSFSTSTSSSSKMVTHHQSSGGDAPGQQTLLPSSVDNSSTSVVRKVYTTDAPTELKQNPGYVDGKTVVTTETHTLPDGSKVTTTRYETKGSKIAAASSSTTTSSSSQRITAEQKSSTTKSSSSKTESHISSSSTNNRAIEEGLNTRNQALNNYNNATEVIRSSQGNEANEKFSQNYSKTSSSTVNVQKSHVTDSRTASTHQDDTATMKSVHQVTGLRNQPDVNSSTISTMTREEILTNKGGNLQENRETDVRISKTVHGEEIVPHEVSTTATSSSSTRKVITKGGSVHTKSQDVRGSSTVSEVHIMKTSQNKENRQPSEIEYVQPSTDSTLKTTKSEITVKGGDVVHTKTTQDDGYFTNIIKDDELCSRQAHTLDLRGDSTTSTTTTRTKEVVAKNEVGAVQKTTMKTAGHDSKTAIQKDVHITKIIQEQGEPSPLITTPGDQTPAISTSGDRTPLSRPTESYTPTAHEIISHLRPIQETTTPTKTEKRGDQPSVTDDYPRPARQPPQYETQERREPIKPGKSELDVKSTPTEGQYQTTYRTDYVNKKISMEVSPTHDAFARSLRAISPDRDKKRGSSLKSSTSSLRSSTSPEKLVRETSPTKSRSPDKFTSTETITKVVCSPRTSPSKSVHADTTTTRRYKDETRSTTNTKRTAATTKYVANTDETKKTTNEIDSSTLTRRSKVNRPRSRSPSPTSIASDIEFIQTKGQVTNLNAYNTTTTEKINARSDIHLTRAREERRPTSLDVNDTSITIKKTKKITDRSPTSPLTNFTSPSKKSPTKDKPQEKPFKRRDTYDERCRQILGISGETKRAAKKTTTDEIKPRASSKSPEKPQVKEYPAQVRKSPEKQPLEKLPEKRRPSKEQPTIKEFPAQVRRSPEKQPLERPPEKRRPSKEKPQVDEYPAQIRRTPEKQPLQKPPEKQRPVKEPPKVQEFPAQIRRSPERRPLEKPSEKHQPLKEQPQVKEYPPQIRKSPERHPLEKPREKSPPAPYQTKIQEFPSQIRRTPERQLLEKPPEKTRPVKEPPKIQEFPSQIRRSPERQSPEKERYIPELGKAPGVADEPIFTKKFISQLCREEEVERSGKGKSPERTLPQNVIELSTDDSDKPRQTVKKASPSSKSPERNLSPGRQHATFINKERADTDITITEYDKEDIQKSVDERKKIETEYTDEYSTDKFKKTTEKSKRPGTVKPEDSDEDTTESEEEEENDETVIKTTTTTTVMNGHGPKQTPTSRKPGITEYPSQKQKTTTKSATKTTTTTTATRKDKKEGKTTLYDVDTKLNTEIDDKPHIRTHRIDDYYTTTKTTKILTNGDVPKSKTTPKKNEPKFSKPAITITVKPTRLSDTSKKVTKKTELITKVASPSREVTSESTRKTTNRNITQTIRAQATPKPEETTTKRHIVTTTIHVLPKIKSEDSKKKVTKSKTLTEEETKTARRTDSKITRTISDQVIKSSQKTPIRGRPKPELLPSTTINRLTETDKTKKKPKEKVITTKSIIINNDYDTEREVVVNLQRSTSSKEPSPSRIYPRPASEDEDTGVPRYPDQICEPDEPTPHRKSTRLSDIPIIEAEDTKNFTKITQLDDNITTTTTKQVHQVDKTDDNFVIDHTVNKFVNETQRITQRPTSPRRKSDVRTDHLTINEKYPPRPKSPKCTSYSEEEVDEKTFTNVSERVSHFIETAEKVKSPSSKTGPVPKVKRLDLTDVDENIKTDDCLLSVSDKVSKFSSIHKLGAVDYKKPVSLAKIDITPKRESPARESPVRELPRGKSPRRESPRRDFPERESPRRESPRRESPRRESPRRESPSKFLTECVQIDDEEQTYTRRTPERKGSYPKDRTTKTTFQETKYSSVREPIDSTPKSSHPHDDSRTVLSPTGRLRSTESIRKAKELFENIAKEQRTSTTKQRDILSRPSVFDGKTPKKPNDVKLTDIGVYKNVRTTDTCKKLRYSSDEEMETHHTEDKLKSTRLILDRIGKSHSPTRDGEEPGYLRPLDRNLRARSPYYDRSRSPKPSSKSPTPQRERSPRPNEADLNDVPHYMWPLDRTPRDHSSDGERSRSRSREQTPDIHGRSKSRESSPERNIPGYMKPLDRRVSPEHEKTTKFGVTLRKTDSGRATTTTTTTTTSSNITSQRRKFSAIEIERLLSAQKFEEIYDLEILEILLERAINYEQRRRIRAQIRIVKQLIAENKLTTVTTTKTTKTVSSVKEGSPKTVRERSPEKSVNRRIVDKSRSEYQTEYTRKTSPPRKLADNKLYQHTDLVTEHKNVDRKSEYQSSYAYNERRTSSEVKSKQEIRNSSSIRSKSPEKPKTRQSPERKAETMQSKSVFKTELKRTTPTSKVVADEKPSWVTQQSLRKTTEIAPSNKKSSMESTTITTKKQATHSTRVSPLKERKSTDIITSSYGVGPTDENGSPLFGLKALRMSNRTDTTKVSVQGTVIRSHYRSENGQEPVGEISITKYSSDPRDFDGEDVKERNGLVSITTTQKLNTKGTPSHKSIADKKKVTDLDENESETVTTRKTTTTKMSRRGSVKEMSKKFIENAVETSKNERQSSYPKAGLILRTSSFKDTVADKRASPEKQETVTSVTVKKTMTSSSSSCSTNEARADTFLNNKTRVRGVQDVITKMKNSERDVRVGESPEDTEARNLLNKFIGSQVILSGMETRSSSSSTSAAGTTGVKRTTTTTTTTTRGGGKPTTTTRTFTHPITESDLETVWDEETLKLLLERSTDYQERRIIRAKLRDVMAEQEVCADAASKTKEESGEKAEEKVETSKTTVTEGPVTTTQVTTTKVTSQQTTKKPVSPFAKFRQLDKQNSLNSPGRTPRTPTGSRPLFKFTDPELSRQASTVKERLLQWCQMKTKEYENIELDNFSSSWSDGLAFCALIHHFLPDAFDYHALTPKDRRHNFTLAFRIADEKADILPLLDVDDMVATRKPDWKCVFTYVQTIYSRFKDQD